MDHYQISNFTKLCVVNLELIAWSMELEKTLKDNFLYAKRTTMTAFMDSFAELIRVKYLDI